MITLEILTPDDNVYYQQVEIINNDIQYTIKRYLALYCGKGYRCIGWSK